MLTDSTFQEHLQDSNLVQLELLLKTTTTGLNAYLTSNDDLLLQIIKFHEQKKKIYSATREAAKFCKEQNE